MSRQRQKLKLSELRIYLDKVEGLPGYYAKMESPVAEGERVSAVQMDLARTFETLGQSKKVADQSYAEMLSAATRI